MTHSMQAAMKNCNNIQQRTKGKKQKKTKGIELMIFFFCLDLKRIMERAGGTSVVNNRLFRRRLRRAPLFK